MTPDLTRRRFLTHANTLGLAVVLGGRFATAGADETATCAGPPCLLDGGEKARRWLSIAVGPCEGEIVRRPGREIEASPFSVGFETLDRRMFDPDRTYSWLARLGVKWARVQTGWARTETSPGKYDFAWLDAVVDHIRDAGVRPWFNLGYGNRLYTPEAPDASAVGWTPIYREEAMTAWRAFVKAAARRYRGRVDHWEIWNEPNISKFWQPRKPNPQDYVRLVRETAAIIRAENPQATIIGGALAGMPTDYFKAMLEAGLGEIVDKISYHPYRPVPEAGYRDTLTAWRTLLTVHAPDVELWQGENGCPSTSDSTGALGGRPWNAYRQAKWVLRRTLFDRVLGLELTSYFHLVDLVNYNWGQGPSGKANTKGLLDGRDYTPKPAYFAYQAVCSLFDHASSRSIEADDRLLIDADSDSSPIVAAFTRNSLPMWCYWTPLPPEQDHLPIVARLTVRDESIRHPVLVDLLTGSVYRLLHAQRIEGGWSFPNVPLADHPFVLTDRKALSVA
ncbi:hypothetical protein JCM19992_09080 [Thermostilla marina]